MIFIKFLIWLKSIYAKATSITFTLDVRSLFFFGGLILLFYGLYIYRPWIAFVIVGIILMLLGWVMEDKKP